MSNFSISKASIIFLFSFFLLLTPKVVWSKTFALVIGNANYQQKSLKLDTSVNDARSVTNKLRLNNVETSFIYDADRDQLEKAIQAFEAKITPYQDRVLIYYSGHGLYQQGQNFLLSTDFQINQNIKQRAIAVEDLIQRLNQHHVLSQIYIIDACRTIIDQKEAPLQLKALEIGQQPLVIMHATSLDQTADQGYNNVSPFTQALLDEFDYSQTKTITNIFNSIKNRVSRLTNLTQIPQLYSFGNNDFKLIEQDKQKIRQPPAPQDIRFFMREIYKVNNSLINERGQKKLAQIAKQIRPDYPPIIFISVMSDLARIENEETGEIAPPPRKLAERLAVARANSFKNILVNEYNFNSNTITTQGGIVIEDNETYNEFIMRLDKSISHHKDACQKENPNAQCILIHIILEDINQP